MVFISYAQNFEDLMLWRALKHIENGFYVDVGANDPELHSVTKAFYDFGWRGINVEPVDQWYRKLEIERPEDINLKVAAGAQKGTIPFYEIPNTGLSTFSEVVAREHETKWGFKFQKIDVNVETLTYILSNYQIDTIHFLKIDAEGAEREVLIGVDFTKFRPWILLVEATAPLSSIEVHDEWEHEVINVGYKLAYVDGLNRFYVAKERSELLEFFLYPPNVFDQFQTINEVELELKAEMAIDRSERLSMELNSIRIDNKILRQKLQSINSSTVWQMVLYLQNLVETSKLLWKFPVQIGLKTSRVLNKVTRRILTKIEKYVLRKQQPNFLLGQFLRGAITRLDRLEHYEYLRNAKLTPRELNIYCEIKTAIEKKRG